MQRVNEKDCKYRGGDWGVKYLMRGPKLDWGVILLKPGQEMGEHGHKVVEETFYFVQGTPKMIVDGTLYRVEVGDAFRVVAPERHNIVNDTAGDVKVIFIKTPYLPDDKT